MAFNLPTDSSNPISKRKKTIPSSPNERKRYVRETVDKRRKLVEEEGERIGGR